MSQNRGARVTDPRFSSVHNDPRFLRLKKRDRKVGIDKRFKSMLEDKDFSTASKVDRYGRKTSDKKGSKQINSLYELEESDKDDSSSSDEDEMPAVKAPNQSDDFAAFSDNDNDAEDVSSEDEADTEPAKYDPARGEGNESSSDDEDELPGDTIDGRDLVDPEPDRENIPQGEVTSRFAVVNLDWDNLHAEDLFVTMNSFKSALGSVNKVSIYPSEFGKERMSREDTSGPPQDIFGVDGELDDDRPINAKTIVKESLGEEFDMAKLRQYQLDRLRYYYAIVECDSPATAKHIYDNCDGAEFEASANFFDLRFVPDGEEFTDEPREVCTSLPELYEPNEFVTDALQHSKVKLTWDNDDPKKAQFAKKAFSKSEIDDMELKAYLASSDSEDGEDASTLKSKWKALLKAGAEDSEDEKPQGDMEITFAAGLSTDTAADDKVDPENETTIEKYKRKDMEKKQRKREKKGIVNDTEEKADLGFDDPFFSEAPSKTKREKKKPEIDLEREKKEKAELDLLLMDDKEGADGKSHFDMKNIVRAEKQAGKKRHKRSKKEEPLSGLQDDFAIDTKDPRFAAVFDNENPHFALDPNDSHFQKTNAMKKVLEARRQSSKNKEERIVETVKQKQKKRKPDDVEDLVRRVKSKSKRDLA